LDTTTSCWRLNLNARIWISELSAGRQLDVEEHPAAFDQQPAAANNLLALAHRLPGSPIDRVPELLDGGMGDAPLLLELLHFFV
jgi:hypothetical protein